MRYYPINLDLRGKSCLVIGGGGVALRKVKRLLECGACVKIVAKRLTEGIKTLIKEGKIEYLGSEYKKEFLEGKSLVIGATNDQVLNAKVSEDAHKLNILCNIVDQPKRCSFILPSVVVRGDLIIAISTSGKSPALAKKIRLDLENSFGDEYAIFLEIMGRVREKMLKGINRQPLRKQLFEKVVNSDILIWLKDKEFSKVDTYLKKTLGEGFGLKDLGFSLKNG